MIVPKKIILSGILFLFVIISAWSDDWFAFGASIGTAAIVNEDAESHSLTKDFHRVVVETDITAELIAHPMIRVALGSIILADFNFKDNHHYNALDYNFYTGIRIYPGLAGLRLGIDYNLGSKTNFIDTTSVKNTYSNQWGNGFRFLLEYDFKYRDDDLLPIIGGSWRHIPRGGFSDHILSVFFKLLYR